MCVWRVCVACVRERLLEGERERERERETGGGNGATGRSLPGADSGGSEWPSLLIPQIGAGLFEGRIGNAAQLYAPHP